MDQPSMITLLSTMTFLMPFRAVSKMNSDPNPSLYFINSSSPDLSPLSEDGVPVPHVFCPKFQDPNQSLLIT
jgi:hypothetical protein